MISVLQKVVDDSSLVVELLFCQAASEVTPGLNFSYIDHLYWRYSSSTSFTILLKISSGSEVVVISFPPMLTK